MKPLNYYQFESQKAIGEVTDVIDLAVPSQSMTVREILRRFASGLPVSGSRSIYYDETPTIDPTLSPDFDLSDFSAISSEIASVAEERKAAAKAKKEGASRSKADDAKAEAKAKTPEDKPDTTV